jgi:hypothetical protein
LSIMSPRDRLAAVLAPDLLDALVAERVAAELARLDAAREDGPRWLTLEQAAERLSCTPAAVPYARQPRQACHASSRASRLRLGRLGRPTSLTADRLAQSGPVRQHALPTQRTARRRWNVPGPAPGGTPDARQA